MYAISYMPYAISKTMLTIRLSRIGRTKQPFYRIIISEKTKDTWGDSLEILGSYNPRSKEFVAKKERITYWLSKGAQTSDTVHNLLLKQGVITGKPVKVVSITKKRKEAIAKKAAAKNPTPAPETPAEVVAETPVVEATPVEEVKE